MRGKTPVRTSLRRKGSSPRSRSCRGGSMLGHYRRQEEPIKCTEGSVIGSVPDLPTNILPLEWLFVFMSLTRCALWVFFVEAQNQRQIHLRFGARLFHIMPHRRNQECPLFSLFTGIFWRWRIAFSTNASSICCCRSGRRPLPVTRALFWRKSGFR